MDRWDKLRKKPRNKLLNQMIDDHPEMTFEQIGNEFNITKQRVSELRQIELAKIKNQATAMEQTVA